MMNTAFAFATGAEWGKTASTAGIVTLVGMAAIFVVLALLWGAIEIMHATIHKGEKKPDTNGEPTKKETTVKAHREKKPKQEKKAKKQPNAAHAADDAAIAAAIAAALAASEDDGAVVAAIIAAISAKLADEGYTGGFRVVSFKRAGAANARRRF